MNIRVFHGDFERDEKENSVFVENFGFGYVFGLVFDAPTYNDASMIEIC